MKKTKMYQNKAEIKKAVGKIEVLHRFLFGGGEGRVCGHGGADTFLGIRVGAEGNAGCFAVSIEVEGSAVLRRPGVPARGTAGHEAGKRLLQPGPKGLRTC